MKWGRASGVLLHITSLPSRFGIGDLGPAAYQFADWLARAGQRIWQVLPLGPVGYGESPYQLFSAFAGNPMLLSIETLVERGWLQESEVQSIPQSAPDRVAFEQVVPWKTHLLRRAFRSFRKSQADEAAFAEFRRENCAWLADYCRFMATKEANRNAPWWEWDCTVQAADGGTEYHEFVQFEFWRQWSALRQYCAARNISIMGDVPIYMARDSAEVWARPEYFRTGVAAGVPPDYFSATGQLWGNPIYNWDRIAAEGYRWWIDRMRAAFLTFDAVRLDHFRGFEAYWEVPEEETTAVRGRWVKGPGEELFRALESALGELPIVAENLGVITPEVEALRHEFGFPGMAILQFAFGNDPQAHSFKPHNYVPNLIAYTGTHDNDTVMGWWSSEGGDSTRSTGNIRKEKAHARAYLATDGSEMNWTLIRTLMMSVAGTVLFPLQDILGLGREGRMNTPATASGNWRWRCPPGAFTEGQAERLREMSELYDRNR
ncbi:MAG TPA: 4-alpha-glucanotransferase [Bryobacteraceae bacterium]|nr:4-alpha-glucanotransferase [Bryobacteraceae bacterium]